MFLSYVTEIQFRTMHPYLSRIILAPYRYCSKPDMTFKKSKSIDS